MLDAINKVYESEEDEEYENGYARNFSLYEHSIETVFSKIFISFDFLLKVEILKICKFAMFRCRYYIHKCLIEKPNKVNSVIQYILRKQ